MAKQNIMTTEISLGNVLMLGSSFSPFCYSLSLSLSLSRSFSLKDDRKINDVRPIKNRGQTPFLLLSNFSCFLDR